MKLIPFALAGVSLFGLWACSSETATSEQKPLQLTIENPLAQDRTDVVVEISVDSLQAWFPTLSLSNMKLMTGEELIPFQLNDPDQDGQADELALMLDLAAQQQTVVSLAPLAEGESLPEFKKRTQAEIAHKVGGHWEDRKYIGGEFKNVDGLAVPPEHTDHSHFIRYEGPGWESDLVGYRFYLDWRNATDIFGKKTTEMVLQDVGLDGFDSYHEPADWGMDVLKVGLSLGIGAPGFWQGDSALRVETTDSINCQVAENGAVESMIRTIYYGWQAGGKSTNLTSSLSIQAGSRLTRHDLALSTALPNLCTGIVKHENAELLQGEKGDWAYLATWGQQSLADDHLGMAILYRKADDVNTTADEHSHVVVFNTERTALTYYFLAAWEQEPSGFQTKEEFISYLDQQLAELNAPAAVTL